MYVLTEPCMRSMLDELNTVKAKLAKAETARDAAKGVDEKEYEDQRQEVISLRSSADALNNRIAAEKQAGRVSTTYTTLPRCSR